jgi:hypothetical protein
MCFRLIRGARKRRRNNNNNNNKRFNGATCQTKQPAIITIIIIIIETFIITMPIRGDAANTTMITTKQPIMEDHDNHGGRDWEQPEEIIMVNNNKKLQLDIRHNVPIDAVVD